MAFGIITGALLGAGANLLMGERANRAAEASADRQMAFQDLMSRTQYQRAVADMKAAGLNPMLAYSQGGNASPSGASSAYQPTDVGGAISTAVQARLAAAQLEKVKADTAKTNVETAAAAATIPGIQADVRTKAASAAQAERGLEDNLALLGFEVGSKGYDLEYKRWKYGSWDGNPDDTARLKELALADYREELARKGFITSESAERLKRLPFETRREIAEALLQEYQVPGARREAEVWDSGYGAIRPFVKDGALGGSAAASAAMLDRAARLAAGRRGKSRQEPQKPGESRLRRPDLDFDAPFPY